MTISHWIQIASISILSFVFAGTINSQSESDKTIRVLTYNIYHGETMKGDFDLDLIAKTINQQNPDFVALQEVDVWTDRAHKMDILTELALRTKLLPVFGQSMPFSNGFYGNGILSKFPIIETRNHQLPSSDNHEARALLEILVKWNSRDTIRFACTHLDHSQDKSDRLKQAKFINEVFKNNSNHYPSILAGDLNAKPESTTMMEFFKYWGKSNFNNEPTAPSKDAKSKIDYILFKNADQWEIVESTVIHERMGSDHLPLLSIFKLKSNK